MLAIAHDHRRVNDEQSSVGRREDVREGLLATNPSISSRSVQSKAAFGCISACRGCSATPRAPLSAALAPPRLGRRGDLALLRLGRWLRLLERKLSPASGSKPSVARLSAKCGGRSAVTSIAPPSGRVDPDPPRVKVQLAADPAGQERLRPAIFARRRRSDGRSPPCARAAGGCGRSAAEARPRRRGCRRGRSPASGSSPEARAPRSMCIFSPPVPGCLASGASIMPSFDVGHADDERPIDLARGAAGEGLGEMAGRARASARPAARPTCPCRAGGRAWAGPPSSASPSSSRSRCWWSWSRPASRGPAAC